MRDIEIIEQFLKPRIKPECHRLGIPPDFIKGIYPVLPPTFFDGSFCESVVEDGKIQGVKIYIDCTIDKPVPALCAFWHEMRHAKDRYEGRKSSEFKATPYSWKRYLQYLFRV